MDIAELYGLLAGPAQRALQTLGLKRLEDLARHSEAEVRALHGIGPSAMRLIAKELARAGIGFKAEGKPEPEPKAGAKAGPKAAPGAPTKVAAASRPSSGPGSIDEYIASFPEATQALLREMRGIIRKAAPEASERISYQMPTFYLNGNLVHFAAFAKHIGFYPLPHVLTSFSEDLKRYKQGKGSIQFPIDEPLPAELIGRIVRFRIEENLAKAAKKKPKR